MSGDRLTRTELSWLLTQEAKSAAEKLRRGVGLTTPPPAPVAPGSIPPRDEKSSAPPSVAPHGTYPTPLPGAVTVPAVMFGHEDTGVESTLNRLDETMSVLASLYGGHRGRRGKIDVAALLWEIAPEARVQIEMGKSGLVVFGDEGELRRMLHVLMAIGGDPAAQGAVEVSVRREGEMVRIAVELGPDKSRGFEAETQWLSRMATRYGGQYLLEGNHNTLELPASEEQREVDELRKELAAAQAQGEAYARELAAVMSSRSEPPPPGARSSAAPNADGLSSLVGMARALVTDVRGILAAIGREVAPLRERDKWGPHESEINDLAASVSRHVTAASEVVSDLARLAGCPLFELPASCNLADVIRDVVKSEHVRATRHGVTIQLDAPPGGLDEIVPPGSVHVLFQELVDSAISVSPADSKVYITLSRSAAGTVLTIDDSGPPLTAKAKTGAASRDFDALVQERASALPLIAGFAVASHLHAPITLEDSPRGGTRVRVLFPHGD
jgi:signal transduction histidine kinase